MTQIPFFPDSPLSKLSTSEALNWLSKHHPKIAMGWGWVNIGGSKRCFDAIESAHPSLANSQDDASGLKKLIKRLINKSLDSLEGGKWTTTAATEVLPASVSYTSVITDQHLSSITLWGITARELTELECHRIESMAAMLGFLHHQLETRQQLEDIQKHMRYMMVWSESIEWITSLQATNVGFYQQLLNRSILLTDASSGALRLTTTGDSKLHEAPHWFTSRMDRQTAEDIEDTLRRNDVSLDNTGKGIEFNAHSEEPESATPLPHSHLLIFPFTNNQISRKALLILEKPAVKDPFSLADQIYLNLLLDQVYSGLERNSLVKELNASNSSLLKEKQEQQVLIQKLQDTQQQLIQSEKLASIGQLAAGVAHEINNPVGFLNSNLGSFGEYCQLLSTTVTEMVARVEQSANQELIKDIDDIANKNDYGYIVEDLPELISSSKEGIQRVITIVRDLKDFSRTDSGQIEPVDINRLIDKTLNIAYNEIKYVAQVHKDFADLPCVEAVESQIGQVLLNILVNAAQAMVNQGSINIRTELTAEDSVLISISDTGSGIAEDILPKLFDPFFTTKPVGKGTGLGLSLSYGIIKRHQGEISVTSEVDAGTTFTIKLPLKQHVSTANNEQTKRIHIIRGR